MRERNQTSVQYLIEATCTVPCVIYSRIRRTMDAVLTLMMAVSMYTAFVMSAWWLNLEWLLHENGFARLAIPPAIFLASIILTDAYSNPKMRWPLKPIFGPTLGFALTSALQLNHSWALPVSVLAWGGALSLVFASMLRLTFLPLTERPQPAKIPAFWQKLELSVSSFRIMSTWLPCAVLLAIIVLLLINSH
ncbi:MAG: hypothetical protein ACRD40_00095 [Candidatus Acidiferrales bacterium]